MLKLQQVITGPRGWVHGFNDQKVVRWTLSEENAMRFPNADAADRFIRKYADKDADRILFMIRGVSR